MRKEEGRKEGRREGRKRKKKIKKSYPGFVIMLFLLVPSLGLIFLKLIKLKSSRYTYLLLW